MTRQIYCDICGGPSLGGDNTWLVQAIMLSTGHRTQNSIEIDAYYSRHHTENGFQLGEHPPEQASRVLLRFNSKYDPDTRNFYLLERKETVRPNVLNESASRAGGGSLYLPVHKACLQLADYFIYTASVLERATADTPSSRITSDLHLWEVLCRRLDQFEHDTIPREPHNFYVPLAVHSCMLWERDYEPDEDFLDASTHALMMANPIKISNVTQCILGNLKAIPETELRLLEAQDECYEQLLKPKTFPWLWDLDTGCIRDEQLSGH